MTISQKKQIFQKVFFSRGQILKKKQKTSSLHMYFETQQEIFYNIPFLKIETKKYLNSNFIFWNGNSRRRSIIVSSKFFLRKWLKGKFSCKLY